MTDAEFTELLPATDGEKSGMDAATEQRELRDMQAALRCYRRDTLHWAERRSAGQPSLAAAARTQERWAALPQWALALVALVTIVGGVAHVVTERADDSTAPVSTAAPVVEHPATAAEIASDNHLLSSIDDELSYHGASPVDGLRLQDGRDAGHAAVTGAAD